MKKLSLADWAILGLLPISLYIGVTQFVYAMRHPEQTDTQRFLHFLDALLWR